MTTKGSLLEHARDYIVKGISAIPLKSEDKRPTISWREYQDRFATDEKLVQWFGNGSKLNIGAVTGKVSGIIAVDLDTDKAVEYAKKNNEQVELAVEDIGTDQGLAELRAMHLLDRWTLRVNPSGREASCDIYWCR